MCLRLQQKEAKFYDVCFSVDFYEQDLTEISVTFQKNIC